jgi:hypothetical protein
VHFYFGNRVMVTHLDKNCASYWNNRIFAHGENIVFTCVPIGPHFKTPKCLFYNVINTKGINLHPTTIRDCLVMGVV